MLSNILILLGVALIGAGVWLKVGRSTPHAVEAPGPVQAAVAPAAEMSAEEKGRAFEDWVVQHLSPKFHKLKDWRGDKRASNGTYAESSTHPDLEVALELGDKSYRFALECKWRRSFMGVGIELDEAQLARYRAFAQDRNLPVFLVLGVGGRPDAPTALYAVPVQHIPAGHLTVESLAPFRQRMTSKHFYYDVFSGELNI